MGYYTKYAISTDSIEHNEQIIQDIIERSEYINPLEEECKWYDHEEDVLEISEKYPTVLIKLEGIGEEPPDMWHKYFKNGQMQTCKAEIVYPEFNESLLQ